MTALPPLPPTKSRRSDHRQPGQRVDNRCGLTAGVSGLYGGAFGSGGKLAFSTAKAIFDTVKKPEVQRGLIAASKNETVRSTVSSVARNEKARTAALNALQDERTLKTVSNIAQAYDKHQSKQKQNDLITLNNPSKSTKDGSVTTNFSRFSEFGNGKSGSEKQSSLYPTLPSSRDYAPYKESKSNRSRSSFTAIHNQLVSLHIGQPGVAPAKKSAPPRPLTPPKLHHSVAASAFPETNEFSGGFLDQASSQKQQPYGYAISPFVATHFDELSVEPNDLIEMEKEVDDQWVYALNKRTGRKGIVPLVCIDVKIPVSDTFASSHPNVPFYARALFDFDSTVTGDLTFHANDEIYVTERVNSDWLRGTIGMRQGIFPANYIQEIPAPLATATTTTTGAASVVPEPSVNWNAAPEYVTAAYDYNSTVDGDLIFKAGDRIEILEWVSGDWLRGRLDGQTGLVPRTYIQTADSATGSNRKERSSNGSSALGTIVTATSDYYNPGNEYLCFSKGDQIEVIEEVNSSWLRGKLLLNMSNTKSFPVGLFPRSAIL